MPTRKKTSVKSETELEKATLLKRRKQKKELKAFQQTSKTENANYVAEALLNLHSEPIQPLRSIENSKIVEPQVTSSSSAPKNQPKIVVQPSTQKNVRLSQKSARKPTMLDNPQSTPADDLASSSGNEPTKENLLDESHLSELQPTQCDEFDVKHLPHNSSNKQKPTKTAKNKAKSFTNKKVKLDQKMTMIADQPIQSHRNLKETIQQSDMSNDISTDESERDINDDSTNLIQKYRKKINQLNQQLERKNCKISKLDNRNAKLEKSSDIYKDLNVQLQRKLLNCKCNAVEEQVFFSKNCLFTDS